MLAEITDIIIKSIPGVLTAGLVAGIGFSYHLAKNALIIRRSSYSGTWFGAIFDDQGLLKKSDRFIISEKKKSADGDVYRIHPHSEHERNWHFSGRIQNHSFFSAYWSEDERNLSSGIWLMSQVSDNIFAGYYYRMEDSGRRSPRRIGAFRMILRKDTEIAAAEYADLLEQIPEIKVHIAGIIPV